MQVEFEAVCRPKFMIFSDDVGDTLYLSTQLTIVYIMFHSEVSE